MFAKEGVQRVGMALLAGLFALAAFGIFIREYNSFYAGAGVAAQSYVTSEGAFEARPLGLQSVAREVGRCFEARAQLREGLLKPEARARGYRACLALADDILHRTPAHGGALQLRAEMLADLADSRPSDVQKALETLLMAAQAAPRTVWLMQRRVALVMALSGDGAALGAGSSALDGPLAQMVARDVAGLLEVSEIHEWLAQQYLRHAALRKVLGQLEGQVMAADAAAFLRRLRKEVRQNGGSAP